MDSLFIVGAGGFARNAMWMIEAINDSATTEGAIHPLGFVSSGTTNDSLLGLPVLGTDEWALSNLEPTAKYVVAIGDAHIREKLAKLYRENGFEAMRLIDPRAAFGKGNSLGAGSMVLACASVSICTRIGSHVILNHNCTVGHDVVIEDYVTVSPGANISGEVHVEKGAMIGAGAVVLPGVRVGKHTTLGAGGVATQDLEAGCTYVGVPARRIR